ncbi:LysR substrate-binding domain-containing protein [Myxococcus sp. K38C18041901]|uniref:LysR family transcriptional regulator n=1 Tax=Myxococcus guangdongensis TaxID=2906760 RepID=UPI0020A7CD35|nr:LysR family transcriptional regulator [Myxococcus guangdongensis]MCP3065484.1 LysR substrate-binding domain-containing protein [Myxococcus guangdongensis]
MAGRDRFESLRTFVEVARAGSLAGAARVLRRAPSAVSRELGALEARLGAELVQRTTRRLQLTAAGERYLTHARGILEALDEAERDLTEQGVPRGVLRVSAPIVFGQWVLVPWVEAFLRAHPEVSVELILEDELVDLVQGGVDVALRIVTRLEPSALVVRRVAVQPYVLCASPGYLREHGTPRRVRELAEHQVLVPLRGPAARPLELLHAGRTQEVRLTKSRFRSNNLPALHGAALRGLGIASLPEYVAAPELASGALVRVLAPWRPTPRYISALYLRRAAMPAHVRAFLDFVTERAAKHFPPDLD